MKRITTFFIITISSTFLYSQTEQPASIQYPKYEIGFSFGAFPLVGFLLPPKGGIIRLGEYGFEHVSYKETGDGSYEKTYHLGSYKLHYNYNWNSKNSVGISLSWVGRYINIYDVIDRDTLDGSGWKHYFPLLASYKRTYYRKDDFALYWGIYWGIIFCIRDKDILYKRHHALISNDPFYINPALQITAFGIEFGTKYVFNMELGIGTLGILNTGFKYRF